MTKIKKLKYEIIDADQLSGMSGVGEGILSKLREFIANGTIKKFEFIQEETPTETNQPLEEDSGQKKAEELYNNFIKSIDNVRDNKDLLNE